MEGKMIILYKKVIETNRYYNGEKYGMVVSEKDLLSHSKEIEMLDINQEMFNCANEKHLTHFDDYCIKKGYKLIKIKE